MKNYFKALANFQQEVPVIHKGTQGYGYTYADLPEILETINPLLKKHGLGFTQEMEGTSLKTTVFHVESGEYRESIANIPQDVRLKGMNDFQVLGSAITYIRRYALTSALGLVTDKDTDASGEQTKKTENKIDVWMNENQFSKAKKDIETAQKAINYFDGKTTQEDGKVYGMKKTYRQELLKIK